MRVIVWKWYSDNHLKRVMDKEYNGEWSYLWDFVKENLPVRRVGAFFVHIITDGKRRKHYLALFPHAEFDFGKGRFLQNTELAAIKTILEYDNIFLEAEKMAKLMDSLLGEG